MNTRNDYETFPAALRKKTGLEAFAAADLVLVRADLGEVPPSRFWRMMVRLFRPQMLQSFPMAVKIPRTESSQKMFYRIEAKE